MRSRDTKIEVELRGGLVAAVRTATDVGPVDYVVVDYDTDGADDDRTERDASGERYTVDGGRCAVGAFVHDTEDA